MPSIGQQHPSFFHGLMEVPTVEERDLGRERPLPVIRRPHKIRSKSFVSFHSGVDNGRQKGLSKTREIWVK